MKQIFDEIKINWYIFGLVIALLIISIVKYSIVYCFIAFLLFFFSFKITKNEEI